MAQNQPAHKSSGIELQELEEAIQLLENPEKAKQLAAQLRKLLQAREQLNEEKQEKEELEKEKRKMIYSGLMKIYLTYSAKLGSTYEKLASEIKSLPLSYQKFEKYFADQENRDKVISVLMNLGLASLVGLIAWLGFRRYTRKLAEKLQAQELFTYRKKIESVLIDTAFKIYPWIGLYLFSYLFLLLFSINVKAESVILLGLAALTIYFAAKSLVYFLLAPETPEKRIIPINDQLSNYIYIWARRILLFSLWMYILVMLSSNLNRSELMKVFSAVYKVGLVLMMAIILAQWKQNIENVLHVSTKEEDAHWKTNLKRIFNNLRGKLYLIVIVYMGVIVVLSILGYSRIYSYLLYSALKSLVIILVAGGLWFLWAVLFKRLFQVSNAITAKFPEVEEKVNRYIVFIKKGVQAIIVLFTILTFLDVWGLGIYGFMTSSSSFMHRVVRIPLIIALSFLLIQVIYYIIGKVEKQTVKQMLSIPNTSSVEVGKRVVTLGRLFRRAASITVLMITSMMVFAELGFDIKPILAGAGIVGLAVGFGAQNLVRDIISGLFLTFENRIRTGDVAIINGTGGLVEQVNLRTTVLRSLDGAVHVFPNGGINTLSNLTHGFSYYVFNVGVAYKEDTDSVISVLKEVGQEIMQDPNYSQEIIEPLEILGLDKFDDSAMVIKARIKTNPIKQWFIGREMNRRIKKRFDELGIEIPFPHRTFYFGEESKAIKVQLEGINGHRQELKQLIHEVLQEHGLNRE